MFSFITLSSCFFIFHSHKSCFITRLLSIYKSISLHHISIALLIQ